MQCSKSSEIWQVAYVAEGMALEKFANFAIYNWSNLVTTRRQHKILTATNLTAFLTPSIPLIDYAEIWISLMLSNTGILFHPSRTEVKTRVYQICQTAFTLFI
jgi:hypothetical protein